MREADARRAGAAGELALITEAAREAGRIAMRYFRRSPDVWMKGGNSPVSEADIHVDRFLRDSLLAARPGYGWLSEETVDSPERLAARRTFVVDPIDGTRAFIEGRETWCVSIAVVEAGASVAGVLDCPVLGEVFHAALGGGAFQDGRPITVRSPGDTPVIGGPKAMIDAIPEPLRSRIATTRYVPSLAYRIALLARGSIDATFVKPNAHDWDLAAADLIVSEAGGAVLDDRGERLAYAGAQVRQGALVAGSGALLEALLETIRR